MENNKEINSLHNYFLNEQSIQNGGVLTDASPAPGASSASDASPASAASSASAASPAPGASSASDASSASSPPKYKLLTEDNIMLPKKLPSNILELLKVKNVYIGIKKDEPIDLNRKQHLLLGFK